jgi:hypothetical protein
MVTFHDIYGFIINRGNEAVLGYTEMICHNQRGVDHLRESGDDESYNQTHNKSCNQSSIIAENNYIELYGIQFYQLLTESWCFKCSPILPYHHDITLK